MKKLLVANRGEIACRIIRAAQDMGIRTVAVYSDADAGALHTRLADEAVHIGVSHASHSYLSEDSILAAAQAVGADAIHPGYGFLSERASFATRVASAGITFVGPPGHIIERMGDKALARATAVEAGVPVVPGSPGVVRTAEEAARLVEDIGLPLVIKAAAGGGGRGIRIVSELDEIAQAISTAQAEARAAFGNGDVYLERYLEQARHIEVQVFGDGEHVLQLGERDCSMQRRRQKLVEEAPASNLDARTRQQLRSAAVAIAEHVSYVGAGTVEFIVDARTGDYFFIEMNTRIQVEHPVTELISGIDLVQEQIRVAAGASLSFRQDDVCLRGHAIEVRVNAENPAQSFFPSPGTLATLHVPSGPFVRVDTGFEAGDLIPPYYDSLIGKLIVWADTRERAIQRMLRVMSEFRVTGVQSTAAFIQTLIQTPQFREGHYFTSLIEDHLPALIEAMEGVRP